MPLTHIKKNKNGRRDKESVVKRHLFTKTGYRHLNSLKTMSFFERNKGRVLNLFLFFFLRLLGLGTRDLTFLGASFM